VTEPLLLTLDAAAALCSVSPRTLRREIDRHELKAVHIGRSIRVATAELERWVQEIADKERAAGAINTDGAAGGRRDRVQPLRRTG